MRSRAILGIGLVLAGMFAPQASSQARDPGHPRKVVERVLPSYPELAKRLSLTGIVRVEVAVDGSGSVKMAKVLGGNPVLAEAAIKAVRQWKYEAASGESTEQVELRFDGKK